jgi:hypothetical protein
VRDHHGHFLSVAPTPGRVDCVFRELQRINPSSVLCGCVHACEPAADDERVALDRGVERLGVVNHRL